MIAARSLCHPWFALALVLGAASATACPQRVPAGLAPTVVGEGIQVSGMRLSILKVQGAEPAGQLLDRVERAWRGEGFDVRRTRSGGWDILAALGERCLTTLQLAERGSANGFFAVNPLARARVSAPMAPPGARLLSSVNSDDDGRRGSISALTSSQSVEALRDYYMRRLHEDDWQGVRAQASAGKGGRIDTVVVSAQRGREQIEVVLWRELDSHIVVNRAEAL